jgi:uncharacterized membrane protein YdbT with pleckstrin-like domain
MDNVDLTGSFRSADAPVIFRGAPSQVVNLLRLVKGGSFVVAVGAITAWLGLPSWVTAAALIVIAGWLAIDVLQVAFTEITIDTERVTARQGILSRRTTSVELFRVQDVEAVQPWWQRPFGIGTVVLHSSDAAFPAGVCSVCAMSMRCVMH